MVGLNVRAKWAGFRGSYWARIFGALNHRGCFSSPKPIIYSRIALCSFPSSLIAWDCVHSLELMTAYMAGCSQIEYNCSRYGNELKVTGRSDFWADPRSCPGVALWYARPDFLCSPDSKRDRNKRRQRPARIGN